MTTQNEINRSVAHGVFGTAAMRSAALIKGRGGCNRTRLQLPARQRRRAQ